MRVRICAAAMMAALLTGCATEGSDRAICAGTKHERTELAQALVDDGGPGSRRAGAVLIGKIDAGCRDFRAS